MNIAEDRHYERVAANYRNNMSTLKRSLLVISHALIWTATAPPNLGYFRSVTSSTDIKYDRCCCFLLS